MSGSSAHWFGGVAWIRFTFCFVRGYSSGSGAVMNGRSAGNCSADPKPTLTAMGNVMASTAPRSQRSSTRSLET